MGADCGFTVELFTFSFDIPVTRFSGQMEPAITAADGGISRVVTAGGDGLMGCCFHCSKLLVYNHLKSKSGSS